VEDGVMKMSYDKYEGDFDGRFGHLFTEELYSYYRIRVEYRFVGEQAPGGPEWAFRNSGIMIHGQPVETMQKDQDFPICIEVQLLGGERDRTTGNLCTPGTNVVMGDKLVTAHCVSSTSKLLTGDQWVTAEAIVHGAASVRHLINGEEVLSYEMSQMGGGNVRFTLDLPDEPVMMSIDRRLISQAITNLVKNGAEAVQAKAESEDAPADYQGHVETSLVVDDGYAVIEVIDNGAGLSKQMRARLLEPYVTTKAKGTGLGLAIVQKVIEQHGGRLELADAPCNETRTSGAMVRLRLPLAPSLPVDPTGDDHTTQTEPHVPAPAS